VRFSEHGAAHILGLKGRVERRDLAMISILMGNFPKLSQNESPSPNEVIRLEAETLKSYKRPAPSWEAGGTKSQR
jgi:hypothetical protein